MTFLLDNEDSFKEFALKEIRIFITLLSTLFKMVDIFVERHFQQRKDDGASSWI